MKLRTGIGIWHRTPVIHVDYHEVCLLVRYKGKSEKVYFDICDSEGRIIKTGNIKSKISRIDLGHLPAKEYVFLLLDGSFIYRKEFSLILAE